MKAEIKTSLREVMIKAPKELQGRMEKALEELEKGLPVAKSGALLSSRITW